MALSAEHAVFPLESDANKSIFYNASNLSPDETITFSDNGVDYEADGDFNSTLSINENDTLLDVLTKTIIHRPPGAENTTEIAIGVTLAVLCNIVVGFSVVLKKQSLKQLKDEGGTPASEGGFGYLKSKRWWIGFSVMNIGEILGFLALIFAPAIVVTSLSVLSIVVAATLSPILLKEKMGKLARIGSGLVIVGCLIVTLCGPKVQEIASMDELEYYLTSPSFITYTVFVVVAGGILMFLAPKYGHKHILVNTLIVGLYGSLSIMFAKGVGIGIKLTFESENAFIRWSFWVCVFALMVSLLIELIYTQRSLDVFTIYLMVPVWYVIITSLVILLSTVVFSSSRTIGWKDTTLTIAGFVVNAAALYILMIEKMQNDSLEKAQESVEAECPPIPRLEGVGEDKISGDQHLYEIRQDSVTENRASASSIVTSMMMRPAVPPRALTNLSAAMCGEKGKTNSCFSLMSETPSSNNTSSKDVSSIDSNEDSNSQSGSTNISDLKSSDASSSGGSSDTSPSSCSSRRRSAGVAAQCCDARPKDSDQQQSADDA